MRQAFKSLEQQDVFLDVFIALLRDIGGGVRDVATAKCRYQHEGFAFFSKTLPLLLKALNEGLSTGHFKPPSNFKRISRMSQIPCFLQVHFKAIIRDDGSVLELNDNQVTAIRAITQVCSFYYKYETPFTADDLDSAIDTFCHNDDLVEVFQPTLNDVIAKNLTTLLFSRVKPAEGAHGPGSVSDHGFMSKYEYIPYFPSKASSFFGLSYFAHASEALIASSVWTITTFLFGTEFITPKQAKGIIVPKDSRGGRFISAEPLEHMFCQKGISSPLKRVMESHPLTRGYINFADQTVNQQLVLSSSISREYSTLDLKNASDLVSWERVKYLFGECDIIRFIEACRTEVTVLEKSDSSQCRSLRKFAPMGSDLCFPILAWVVFVTIYARLVQIPSLRDARGILYVYGDDVVVKTEYASLAVSALEDAGLQVNTNKSFINSYFLESCGTDAYKGYVVTPVRARRLLTPLSMKLRDRECITRDLVKTVSLGNQLRLRGYMHASEAVFKQAESLIGSLPYGTAKTPFLCRICEDAPTAWRNNAAQGIEEMRKGFETVKAYGTSTAKMEVSESLFGRLRRREASSPVKIHEDISVFENPIDEFGFKSVPRKLRVKRRSYIRDYVTGYTRAPV